MHMYVPHFHLHKHQLINAIMMQLHNLTCMNLCYNCGSNARVHIGCWSPRSYYILVWYTLESAVPGIYNNYIYIMGARVIVVSSKLHFKDTSTRYANVKCKVRQLNLAIVQWPRDFTHMYV